MENNRIIIFDTTLRDGEQTPGVNLNLTEKLEIAKQLEALGVDIIEAGFPAASNGDYLAVKGVASAVNCSVAALCRCLKSDIDRGWDAVKLAKKPRLHLFLATSEIHMKYKLKSTPDEVFERATSCVAYAKSLCSDIEFSCEDASRSDLSFICKILEAVIDAGATTVNIPDTVGYKIPNEFGSFIAAIKANVPNIAKAVISVHCHNDLGLAVSNTISAIQNGARQIETTVNGIGERAGNCAVEEVIMALTTRKDLINLTHNIDTSLIYRSSKIISKLTGVPIHVCKPIVGDNAFAHESGIHQHGVLANPLTYEIMTPQSVGKTESTLVLGKLSGRHAFSAHLESLGYHLSKGEIDEAFTRFKELADKKKKITNEDIEAIALDNKSNIPQIYKLENFKLTTGANQLSSIEIEIKYGDKVLSEVYTADGPITTTYSALAKLTEEKWPLASYDIKAIPEGDDALGEVIVRLKKNGRQFTGKSVSHNIIEASILAYLDCVNRALAEEQDLNVLF
ncbi:MAG: 2-isopropylmalate synthase [Christensenellaceae bacterium]|jgi:2-isopropylmalate synthase|nr:2-isopropylmalate synthase [Christensenellaceae bacterium]